MDFETVERFTEFLIIGVALGVIEDLIAIKLATDASFNPEVLIIIAAVAVPFAAFSELVVDNDEYRITEKIAEKIKNVF